MKLSIVIGMAYFVYHRLTNNQRLDIDIFWETIQNNRVFHVNNILVLLLLSALNWILEGLKWKALTASLKRISFKDAMEQSLGALTASLLTPNRIGEYGAKVVYYSKNHRKKVLFLNLWSNMLQMSVTIILGAIGLYFFLSHFEVAIDYYRILRSVAILIAIVVAGLFGLRHRRLQIKGFSFQKIKEFVQKMTLRLHIQAWALSLLRYATFSFQFFFLLQMFGITLTYFEAMMLITSMYLIASLVPTVFIFDVVIRGGAAVWLFGFMQINELTILCITSLMWLLNFVLPSVFGSYYVLNFNAWKTDNE
ncbi:lysylphosphatidylglycerol synthase domain-containing protein [Sungkyunkwania multivorans]|uniref:Lysylphosphatidylglycerol synthase domain-containing protein n=1 Tax=Sungkyunkwania multivorans TaxID=1173618 RepID=A0ABW3D1Y6_9FLAO